MSWALFLVFAILTGVYASFSLFKPAVFCLFTAAVFPPLIFNISKHAANLGTDSFQEATRFSYQEAFFWISTVLNDLSYGRMFRHLLAAFAIAATVTLILKAAQRKALLVRFFRSPPSIALIFAVVTLSVAPSMYTTYQAIEKQSKAFINVSRNFNSGIVPTTHLVSQNLTVFVYVGESVSAMNMGAYGYHRDTTPNLDEIRQNDPNLLIFTDVFSTHTHTSPSLLEALSLGRSHENVLTPITERPRLSVIDLLEQNGVRTALYSNQDMAGTWNQASSIIFRNSSHRHFSADTALFGNGAAKHVDRPWDHEFLDVALRDKSFNERDLSVVFFHSYAGHGPYKKFVPPSHANPPRWNLQNKSVEAMGGGIAAASVDNYDRAITYVDKTLSKAIRFVKGQAKPVVLVFFADHGESVFTNRGHDSSRFIHEMTRIPFILYFNDAARAKYDETFKRYWTYSQRSQPSTLAQFSSTLIDILGASSEPLKSNLRLLPSIGDPSAQLDPILVRQVGDKVTYIDLYAKRPNVKDDSTNHYIISKQSDRNFCYHRSNSFAKFRRAQLVSRCIELDLFVNSNGEIAVFHPPVEDAGLRLDDFFSNGRTLVSTTLWLDGKNIGRESQCLQMLRSIEKYQDKVASLFVEFPTESIGFLRELATCMKRLVNIGARTSYYVSTVNALPCSKAINRGEHFNDKKSCQALFKELVPAIESGLFTDLSFDYSGLPAVRNVVGAKRLKWNTWNFPKHEIGGMSEQDFDLIILKNNDPNTR